MWPYPEFPADLVTFTEEILNEKLYFFEQWNNVLKPEQSLHWSNFRNIFYSFYFYLILLVYFTKLNSHIFSSHPSRAKFYIKRFYKKTLLLLRPIKKNQYKAVLSLSSIPTPNSYQVEENPELNEKEMDSTYSD